MKPRLFDGEHVPVGAPVPPRHPAAMKPRLFDGEHFSARTRTKSGMTPQ